MSKNITHFPADKADNAKIKHGLLRFFGNEERLGEALQKEKAEAKKWRTGYWRAMVIVLIAFIGFWAYNSGAARTHKIYQQEIEQLKQQQANHSQQLVDGWQKKLQQHRQQSRHEIASIEKKAQHQIEQANKKIQQLLKQNENFNAYYQTPAPGDVVDLVWGDQRLQHAGP